MQTYKLFIGIDISKKSLDACVHWHGQQGAYPHHDFDNKISGFEAFLKWVHQVIPHPIAPVNWIIGMEHTGWYGLKLAQFLEQQSITYIMDSPLRISRSLGLKRGKDDPADAAALTNYILHRNPCIKVRPIPTGILLKTQALLSLRARLVKYQGGLKVALKEHKFCFEQDISSPVEQATLMVTQPMKQQILQLDKTIKKLLCSQTELKKLYQLVGSVKGIGPVITAYLLVYTNAFTAFDNARQFASFIGVVPFRERSGTSINKPDRVSHIAQKRIKTLFYMAATTAVTHDPQIRAFFKRQQERGKEEGWIYNAVKNKIIHRIFAVVREQRPYVVLGKHLK